MKKRRLLTALALVLLTGCWSGSEGGCRAKKLTQRQADYITMSLLADQFNAAQTNWTLTIKERSAPSRKAVWTSTMQLALTNGQALGYQVTVHTNDDGRIWMDFNRANGHTND